MAIEKTVVKQEVPTIKMMLGPNSTVVEVNDAMLKLPATRLERAFREAHKTVHRERLKRRQADQAAQAKVLSTK